MKLSRIVPAKLLLVGIIALSIRTSNGFSLSALSGTSRSLAAFAFLFSASGIPNTFSLPNRKADLSPKIKNSGYYRWANNLLSWVFDKLEASDEDEDKSGPGRSDADSLEDSSEEDAASRREAAEKLRKQKKIQSRNKGRLGNVSPPVKQGGDPEVEKATLPELKTMLTKLKRQDNGIFSTQAITNPVASPLWTFGTSMFRKVFCGLKPQNSYCIQDDSFGAGTFFDGFKRALRSLGSQG